MNVTSESVEAAREASPETATQRDATALTVYFDGACPLCRREIAFLRRRNGAEQIEWCDLTKTDDRHLPSEISREQALARFHVRSSDGRLLGGAEAFAALWSALPATRVLGHIARQRAVIPVLDRTYRAFLRLRPRLQALATSLEARTDTPYPQWLIRELRSDHAGETGAVAIYRGILAVSRDDALREFATRHLATEQAHLQTIEALLPHAHRSRLLLLWRIAGYVTGALPALLGPRAVYFTIEAVESFVDRHYSEQIDALSSRPDLVHVRDVLASCRADEIAHRDEAKQRAARRPGPIAAVWRWLVGTGSQVAVALARRI